MSRKVPPTGYLCHNCRQPGHWIGDCPLPRQSKRPRDDASADAASDGAGAVDGGGRGGGGGGGAKRPKGKKKQSGPPDGYVCRMCSTPGHFIADCPTRNDPTFDAQSVPQGGMPGVGSRGVPAGDYVCHRCHMRGHFIQDCPTNGDPAWNRPVGGVPPPHYTCNKVRVRIS